MRVDTTSVDTTAAKGVTLIGVAFPGAQALIIKVNTTSAIINFKVFIVHTVILYLKGFDATAKSSLFIIYAPILALDAVREWRKSLE